MPEYQQPNDHDYGYTQDPSPSSLPSDYEYSDMQSLMNAMRRDGIDVDNIIRQAKTMDFNNANQDDKSLFDKLKQYYIQYRDTRRNRRQERGELIRD